VMEDTAVVTHLVYVERFPFEHTVPGTDGDLLVRICADGDALLACADDGEPQGSHWASVDGACWAIVRVASALIQSGCGSGWSLLRAIAAYQEQAATVLAAIPAIDPNAPVQ